MLVWVVNLMWKSLMFKKIEFFYKDNLINNDSISNKILLFEWIFYKIFYVYYYLIT